MRKKIKKLSRPTDPIFKFWSGEGNITIFFGGLIKQKGLVSLHVHYVDCYIYMYVLPSGFTSRNTHCACVMSYRGSSKAVDMEMMWHIMAVHAVHTENQLTSARRSPHFLSENFASFQEISWNQDILKRRAVFQEKYPWNAHYALRRRQQGFWQFS